MNQQGHPNKATSAFRQNPSRSESSNNTNTPPKAFSPWLFWSGITVVCVLAITGSILSQRLLKKQQLHLTPLPKIHSVSKNMEALERNGNNVTLSELNGKVRVFAYIYTVCPHGCAAVIGEMIKLNNKFGQHPDFHQVSISVVPDRDTTEMLKAYGEGIGLKPDSQWWFLTGDQENLWSYMTDALKLEPAAPIPEEEQLNPLDLYAHDLRIVLMDRTGNVRGYYSVFHPQAEIASLMCERLQTDVERLLNNPDV